MTLQQVKTQLGYPQLNLNTANDVDGNPTNWMRHWDNDDRVAVSIHTDLIKQIKSNPSLDTLEIQSETRTGEKGDYTAKRIVAYKPAEMTL